MAKIQLSDHQLLVDGVDLSNIVAAGSPHLQFRPDGTAKLNVDIVTTAFDIDIEGLVETTPPAERDDVRSVVLTKPGDTLLIGNMARINDLSFDQIQAVTELFGALGIKVAFFTDDIDIAKLPADA